MARFLGTRYLRKIVWLNCLVVSGIFLLYFHGHQSTDVRRYNSERSILSKQSSLSNASRIVLLALEQRKNASSLPKVKDEKTSGYLRNRSHSPSLIKEKYSGVGSVVKNTKGQVEGYHFDDISRLPPPQKELDLHERHRRAGASNQGDLAASSAGLATRNNSRGADGIPLYSEKVKINQHDFDFLISNGNVCRDAGADLFLVILVFNTHLERENRDAIREHWGGEKSVRGRKVITMFLLGTVSDRRLQEDIERENDIHGDIIQENFIDNYNNLTLKTIMGFKWVSLFCHWTEYVMKVDGRDVFVIPENVVSTILHHATKTGFAEGNRFRKEKPVRDIDSKWYTSYDMFQEATYPPYLEGPAYVMSSDVAKQIYVTSEFVRYLPWEDAYVGLVLKRIGVAPRQGWYYDVPWYSVPQSASSTCSVVRATTIKFSSYDISRSGYMSLCVTLQSVIDRNRKRCRGEQEYKND